MYSLSLVLCAHPYVRIQMLSVPGTWVSVDC